MMDNIVQDVIISVYSLQERIRDVQPRCRAPGIPVTVMRERWQERFSLFYVLPRDLLPVSNPPPLCLGGGMGVQEEETHNDSFSLLGGLMCDSITSRSMPVMLYNSWFFFFLSWLYAIWLFRSISASMIMWKELFTFIASIDLDHRLPFSLDLYWFSLSTLLLFYALDMLCAALYLLHANIIWFCLLV